MKKTNNENTDFEPKDKTVEPETADASNATDDVSEKFPASAEAETTELSPGDVEPTAAGEKNEAAAETALANEGGESEETIFDENGAAVSDSASSPETVKELPPDSAKTATADNSRGAAAMSASSKALVVLLVIAVLGAGLVFWKAKVGAAHGAVASFDRITKEEMELLLKDANPMMLKQLEDPEKKKEQLENLKQLLALASAAKKEGLADQELIKNELENVRTELTAINYDRAINKDKGQMPPFSFIKQERIKEFWGEDGSNTFLDKIGVGPKYRREAEFKKFLDTKLELAKEAGQITKDYELKDEELEQAKEYFAKTRIYAEEAREKQMGEDFQRKLELMIKLQQAQYLSRLYAKEKLVDKTKVTDADIDQYLKQHPELAASATEKKAKAEEVLRRAKAGDDFAALAKEFSGDPGSKDNGGLYENVPQGQMVPEFEQAALSLEPGQVAPNLVETQFGYHIIKLEKKNSATNPQTNQPMQTYDVRHILFSTTVKDPENPLAREVPAKEFVRAKLEEEKEKKVLEEILANNPVQIAEDFEIPKVSDEQMQEMMRQQMPTMPQGEDMPQMEEPQPKETKKTQPKKK